MQIKLFKPIRDGKENEINFFTFLSLLVLGDKEESNNKKNLANMDISPRSFKEKASGHIPTNATLHEKLYKLNTRQKTEHKTHIPHQGPTAEG